MQDRYPHHQVFRDIALGLNEKRKGLKRLLEQVQKGHIKEVVVAHKDRLARFGVELIQWVIELGGASLVILREDKVSPQQVRAIYLSSSLSIYLMRVACSFFWCCVVL